MGLFGFVKKIGGKILKAGLSVATRGVSDKVLAGLKGLNLQKKKKALLTRSAEAMALKHLPTTKSTTVYARDLLERASRGAGSAGDERSRTDIDGSALPGARKSRRAPKRRKRASASRIARPAVVAERSPRPKSRAAKPRAARSGRKAPASFAKYAARAKELAAEWRAAGGKEGTGKGFFEWKKGKG